MGKMLKCLSVVLVGLTLIGPVGAAERGAGKVLFEYWFNVTGVNVANLTSLATYPGQPDDAEWRDAFDSRIDWRDRYGVRARGYVIPPQTGDYTFWIAGDDYCELWLSTDANPDNAAMIAEVPGWTPARDWLNTGGGGGDAARQKSTPIALKAGQKYYMEALMKEEGGGDSVSVAWGGPGIGAGPKLLASEYCVAFLRDPEPLFQARHPDPPDGTIGVPAPAVGWTPGVTAKLHDIYFGTDPNPPLVSPLQPYLMYYYFLAPFEPGVTYYWRVDEVEKDGVTKYPGPVWSFVAQAVTAYYPQPADGAKAVSPTTGLSWMPGVGAARHHLYLSDDPDAVAQGTAAADKGELDDPNFAPGGLDGAVTYYWRVDETGIDGTIQTGLVWSFTTCILVDDFESYNDDEGTDTRIYETWIDGLTNGTTSTVGNWDPPFAEQGIVHGGRQSMPIDYNSINQPYYAEAEREFSPLQDWAAHEVNDLSLWFRGRTAPVAPVEETTAGKLTVTGEGADIWGSADQFTFVYKILNGDGTLVARVTSIGTGSNRWAKGGAMIRDGLDAGAASAQMVLTGGDGNGGAFQNRASTDLDMGANDATSNTTMAAAIAPPYWVKIERKGDLLSGSTSPNGTTWTQLGTSAAITMSAPVYLGLCVTSHAAGQYRTFEFDNVKVTGSVTGSWQTKEIGLVRNSTQPVYLVIGDSAGKTKTITHPNPAASTLTAWTEWKIPLRDLTGISLSKIKTMRIGIGDPAATTPDGNGRLYIDEIRVTRP